jgi:uncharacterized membrane protein
LGNLESDKNLAGVGALLLALGAFVPVIGIVGIILLVIGMKGLSEYYNDRSIYQNALWGVIFGIIGLVAVAVVGIGFIFTGALFAFSGMGLLAVGVLILALLLLFVFYLLAAIYFRKAFSVLGQKTGEHIFETAGLLLFVGAILTIILIGLVLVFVAWILVTVAFFSIRAQPQQTTAMPTQAPVSFATATRYCPNCGRAISPDVKFCPYCGKEVG